MRSKKKYDSDCKKTRNVSFFGIWTKEGKHFNISTVFFAIGFSLMVLQDVALG